MSPIPVLQKTRGGVQFTIKRTGNGDHTIVIDGNNIIQVSELRSAGWNGDNMDIAKQYAHAFIDGVVDPRVDGSVENFL